MQVCIAPMLPMCPWGVHCVGRGSSSGFAFCGGWPPSLGHHGCACWEAGHLPGHTTQGPCMLGGWPPSLTRHRKHVGSVYRGLCASWELCNWAAGHLPGHHGCACWEAGHLPGHTTQGPCMWGGWPPSLARHRSHYYKPL